MFECKHHHRIAGIAILVVALALTTFLVFRTYEIIKSTQNYSREISVDAQGVSYSTPDLATIGLGVSTEDSTADKAVENNTKKMNEVLSKIKELGIESKDIQTTNYYLSPKYEWTQDKGSFQNGYMISQDVIIKVRDLTKVGEVLTVSTKAGANVVGNVSFSIEDPEKAKTEARDIAIAKVKEKAKMIAEQTGLKLGKVTSYYEYQDYNYGKGGGYPMMAEGGGATTSDLVTIEPGQEATTLTVTLTYKVY